jgi:hypothetical protein
MKVLILCEESQALCKAFRALGHDAYSCDLLPCSGGHPEWHIHNDAVFTLKSFKFYTQDNNEHYIENWDLIILHPMCTKVAVSGNSTYANTQDRIDAANWNANLYFLACSKCDRVAMEQPVTVLRSIRPDLPKPQYVDIWWFGDKECKKTAWFTKGLPLLKMTNNIGPPPKGKARYKWMKTWLMSPSDDRGHLRSKLNPKMAAAVAKQWSV